MKFSNEKNHSSNVPHRLTLSVGGMTCTSCTTAITQALVGLPGVRDVSVSLLGNSAAAILNDKVMVTDVLEAIENLGYEADVASLQPLDMDATTVVEGKELIPVVQDVIKCAGFEASVVSSGPVDTTPKVKEIARIQRTVNLRVEGMFCE
jgi:copper chaperone CopZ